MFPDFQWSAKTNGKENKVIIEKIWGKELAAKVIGAMPIPYIFQYKQAVYKLVIKEISKVNSFKRAVVFDFDGTWTKPRDGYNTWEELWLLLGYPVSMCEKYHRMYSNGEISHDEWCEITEKYFKEKGLHKRHLQIAAKNAELLPDVKKTILHLKSKGILLYILSGSIKQYIEIVLGKEIAQCFTEIKANRFLFDAQGNLEGIIGTPYDFEGKAKFVTKIISETSILPQDILYVGNSFNDEFVYESGVETFVLTLPIPTTITIKYGIIT